MASIFTQLISNLPVGWVPYPVMFPAGPCAFEPIWKSYLFTTSYGSYVIVSLDLIVPYTGTTWINNCCVFSHGSNLLIWTLVVLNFIWRFKVEIYLQARPNLSVVQSSRAVKRWWSMWLLFIPPCHISSHPKEGVKLLFIGSLEVVQYSHLAYLSFIDWMRIMIDEPGFLSECGSEPPTFRT